MKLLEQRHQAKQIIRHYFDEQNFIEIDSPILVKANAIEAFIDPIRVGREELRTSPELYHKRLLARGYQKIYEFGHVFRDEQEGRLHLREFMLLEWYRAGASLSELIEDCEALFYALAPELFNQPFEINSLQELWAEHVGIDLREAILNQNLVKKLSEKDFVFRENADFSDAFTQVMLTVIEPKIGQRTPCVVTRWPRNMASLAQICSDDFLFAERFEIYFQGVELANAFLELQDPVIQRERFVAEAKIRSGLGKQSSVIDENFLEDLTNMPSAAGIALGFDRLLMLISGALRIQECTRI